VWQSNGVGSGHRRTTVGKFKFSGIYKKGILHIVKIYFL
jgi:hypothetical protein